MKLSSAGRILPAAGIAGIYWLSAIPAHDLPAGPGIPHFDKVIHAAVYAVLLSSFRYWRGARRAPREWLAGAVAACLVAAAGDEWHQGTVPGRSPDPLDLLADSLGIAAAAAVWAGGPALLRHRILLGRSVPTAPAAPGASCAGSASPRSPRSSGSP